MHLGRRLNSRAGGVIILIRCGTPMRTVPQAASCAGGPMTRQILIVIGTALLSFGGIGLIVGVVWLVAGRVQGTLPYLLEARFETLLYVLPAILLAVAAAGASFMISAMASQPKNADSNRNVQAHPHFHA